MLLKLIKSYFPEKQKDRDGPISLTRANLFAFAFQANISVSRTQVDCFKTFVSDMMVL